MVTDELREHHDQLSSVSWSVVTVYKTTPVIHHTVLLELHTILPRQRVDVIGLLLYWK